MAINPQVCARFGEPQERTAEGRAAALYSSLIADLSQLNLLGGRGYNERTPLAKMYRDARTLRIFDGPTEALLSNLGRCLLSKATRDEVTDLFRSLCASSIHAAAIEELSALNETDGAPC
ncbi:hypothetical protein I6F31_04575 [Bradyrhizobium sp. NBAIM01]|nr:hypothetical protein [Bradyrhizobium sp. NBAIM01]